MSWSTAHISQATTERNRSEDWNFQGSRSAMWLLSFGAFATEMVNANFWKQKFMENFYTSLSLPVSCVWRVNSAKNCIGNKWTDCFPNVSLMCLCLTCRETKFCGIVINNCKAQANVMDKTPCSCCYIFLWGEKIKSGIWALLNLMITNSLDLAANNKIGSGTLPSN